jgi:hypothetical protein
VTLRTAAAEVLTAYADRLRDERGLLAFEQALDRLRRSLGDVDEVPVPSDEVLRELHAMKHVAAVLGSLASKASQARALLIVALSMAPDAFSEREYCELLRRAKGP